MAQVDGIRLKQLREKRGWTQERLAQEARIDKGTISRRERDRKASLANANTVEQLCKALKTTPDILSGVAPLPDDPPRQIERAKGEVRLKMDDQGRNALALVSMRYGMSPDQVVAIAPLLFFIAAEASLAERRTACTAAQAALDAVNTAIGRLPGNPMASDGAAESAVEAEFASIKRKDLFGRQHPNDDRFGADYDPAYDEGTDNPFVKFLAAAAAKVAPQNDADGVRIANVDYWDPDFSPAYHVCGDDALRLANGNPNAARGVLTGAAPLHEMRKDLSGSVTAEQIEAWALERVDRAEQELIEMLGIDDISESKS